MSARAAAALVVSSEWTDANPMLNMSSFVTTFAEPEAVEDAKRNMFKNYIDHDMYPQVFAMETRMVRWLHQLWNGPKDVEPYGTATVGSSEACMLAGLAHKWNWRKAREKARQGRDAAEHGDGRQRADRMEEVPALFRRRAAHRAAQARATTGSPPNSSTSTSTKTPSRSSPSRDRPSPARTTISRSIHDWLDAYEKKTGISIPMHIDGASGGFVNPFLYPDYKWDFRLPRVQSINASGHKFGLTPPGLGWVVFRERKVFNEDLVFYVNYLGGEMPTATLELQPQRRSRSPCSTTCSCGSASTATSEACSTRWTMPSRLREVLVESGYFTIMNETQRIPVVAVTLDQEGQELQRIRCLEQGAREGLGAAAYTMPPNAEEVTSLRVVVRPHINRNVAEMLARDIVNACKYPRDSTAATRRRQRCTRTRTEKTTPAKC